MRVSAVLNPNGVVHQSPGQANPASAGERRPGLSPAGITNPNGVAQDAGSRLARGERFQSIPDISLIDFESILLAEDSEFLLKRNLLMMSRLMVRIYVAFYRFDVSGAD